MGPRHPEFKPPCSTSRQSFIHPSSYTHTNTHPAHLWASTTWYAQCTHTRRLKLHSQYEHKQLEPAQSVCRARTHISTNCVLSSITYTEHFLIANSVKPQQIYHHKMYSKNCHILHVRYHTGGSMKLNTRILHLAYMVYL